MILFSMALLILEVFIIIIGEINWRKLSHREKTMSLWAING